MAFNTSTNKIAVKKLIKKHEAKFTGRVSVNQGKIDKVLEGQGRISITSCEKIGDGVQVLGSATLDAFYLDDEKQVRVEQITQDFNERVRVNAGDELFVVPLIKDVKLHKEDSAQLVVTTTVEFKIYGIIYEEIETVGGSDNGCHTISHEIETNQLIASTNSSFTLSSMLDIPENATILSMNSLTALTSLVARENYAEIEGNSTLDVWFVDSEQIKKTHKNIEFKEEIPLLNSRDSVVLDCVYYDRDINFSKEENTIDINVGIALWAMDNVRLNVIDDAFSEVDLLDLTTSQFDNPVTEATKIFSERKTIVVDTSSKKRVDEVVMIGSIASEICQTSVTDAGIILEGKISFPIIYKNYDNDEIISANLSSAFDMLISSEVKEGQDLENILSAEIKSRINSYKNKAGKEISMVVDFEGYINSYALKKDQYVSKIEKKECPPRKKSSIVVYKPKENQSVFSIAKTLKISPDVLRAQNPQLEDGVHCGQVVVYTKF